MAPLKCRAPTLMICFDVKEKKSWFNICKLINDHEFNKKNPINNILIEKRVTELSKHEKISVNI